jgi:hypothetical protein
MRNVSSRWGRRQVLAGTLALAGGARWSRASPVGVTFDTELEPLVRLVEETPRDRIIEVAAEKIRGGARHAQLLAAVFLAGVRGIRARPVGFEFHCVLAVHSAHLIAQEAPEADRWVPVLWTLDQFKRGQQRKREKREGEWRLPLPVDAKLPPAAQARQRYLEAMAAWDEEAADRAITALVRAAGPEAIRDLIFRHAARDFRDIGHKAIYAANAWRTLKVIGWQHAEPVLRSLTFASLEHDGTSPAQRDAPEDRPWRQNLERVASVRADWPRGAAAPGATTELLQQLRGGSPGDASAAVAGALNAGAAPASVWDALFLAGAELAMRHLDIISLHAVTSMNALHHAYRTVATDETRLLMMLQGAAFLALFRGELGEKKGARVDTLDAGGATLTEAVTAARRQVLARGDTAHDYKLGAAVLEDVQHLSERWRSRYLAANLKLFPRERPNPLSGRIRAALRG